MNARSQSVRIALCAAALTLLGGCDKIKDMIGKGAVDAAVDAAPVVTAPVVADDAGVDAAPPPVVVQDDIPGPADEEARANRDIGFGNFKEELDKLEKEPDKPAKK